MKKTVDSFPAINAQTLSTVSGGNFSFPIPSWHETLDSVKGFLDGLTGHKRHYD
ncbi:hypothetical protein [Schleiferilactobacillus shenzhenensis]|uniref:Uncharacterized protein n=1 Tax=Schleiferilactobacillus shenzhenensis LY-73 TaxID=1231336 RepID=U4TM92_9LACO|nr:hypothetical protein [Schleiferilactobacillus shenzhenensis]ERL65996.1 hypothetical protein L248_2072 [Schleiferilactobacillus shenzhenensis LY-73]